MRASAGIVSAIGPIQHRTPAARRGIFADQPPGQCAYPAARPSAMLTDQQDDHNHEQRRYSSKPAIARLLRGREFRGVGYR